ncbi:MAG: Peptide chain release factor 2 [candidate division WS6 bacterium GW2011_GWC1_36_11]|uniref:Peptide chain release factor 2 n=2 Tax=Candidatus Dojkabacteria TaxID=74243 RepID=A0A0G0FS31_9BACT|nr:MAG: Peptide chain release factor 2 [candidate division WS6 bacterium GW2011_GWC1_36_11]KKQ12136.1 MAG: Peptide chain release factor 2 [candidate division WS6 bacterium GW2011_GWC2_36_7]HAM96231.1 peptide chain release factor 2 [Patescibacteria group bacterium]
MVDLRKKDIQDLQKDISDTLLSLDLDSKKSKLKVLEDKTILEDFWKDTESAKKIMEEAGQLREEIETAEKLQQEANSLVELFNSIERETDQNQLIEEYESIRQRFDKFSIRKFLSSKYDKANAILTIHAGQGGTESNDWASILMRMYTMYFDKMGWKYNISEILNGTETGIVTVTMDVIGTYAFGYLKREHGTHRLVRISPFNAQGLRQTTFAGVEVLPIMEDVDLDIQIPETDLEFKAVRAGGPGGQNVNKTSSAVQITHMPTGITVQSSEQRSQLQNRETAMKVLKAKLLRIKMDERLEEISQIKGDYKIAGWGNQIRNYVLHPYKLVKDLRTGIESQNPESVLDGNLEEFVEAEIRLQ